MGFDRKYEILESHALLGEGTYGRVFKALNKQVGNFVAVKKMKLDTDEEGIPSNAIREIALLKELTHVNVVELLDVCYSPSRLILVFEFVEQDLKKYMISMDNVLPQNVVKNLTFQLCRGIDVCHANGILHRDIKPENLLIDIHLRLKIADFGLARDYTIPIRKYTRDVMTVWYRPPEILFGLPIHCVYSVPADLWSVWCVVAEMATGGPLFPGDSEIDTIFKIFQNLGTPTTRDCPVLASLPVATFPQWPAKGWTNIRNIEAQVGNKGIDLLEKGMVYDPSKRISARRALQHPYFGDVDADLLS